MNSSNLLQNNTQRKKKYGIKRFILLNFILFKYNSKKPFFEIILKYCEPIVFCIYLK